MRAAPGDAAAPQREDHRTHAAEREHGDAEQREERLVAIGRSSFPARDRQLRDDRDEDGRAREDRRAADGEGDRRGELERADRAEDQREARDVEAPEHGERVLLHAAHDLADRRVEREADVAARVDHARARAPDHLSS